MRLPDRPDLVIWITRTGGFKDGANLRRIVRIVIYYRDVVDFTNQVEAAANASECGEGGSSSRWLYAYLLASANGGDCVQDIDLTGYTQMNIADERLIPISNDFEGSAIRLWRDRFYQPLARITSAIPKNIQFLTETITNIQRSGIISAEDGVPVFGHKADEL